MKVFLVAEQNTYFTLLHYFKFFPPLRTTSFVIFAEYHSYCMLILYV